MHLIKENAVDKNVGSTNNSGWDKISDHKELFKTLLRSSILLAYVDITYNFLINIIPYGVLLMEISSEKNLGSSYSRDTKVGTEMVTVVSLLIYLQN